MTFQFNPEFPDATDDQKWDQIRLWRNQELASTDWTQLSDATVDTAIWANYRQNLRDVPQQNCAPDQVVWPTKPQ